MAEIGINHGIGVPCPQCGWFADINCNGYADHRNYHESVTDAGGTAEDQP